MPLLYLEASAVVAALGREAATERVQQFLKQQGDDSLAISGWVITEASSALALEFRREEVHCALFAAAHARISSFAAAVVMPSVTEKDVSQAALFCQRHELGLRAGDALHLAVAAQAGCMLVTLDERMAKVAPELGVSVADI